MSTTTAAKFAANTSDRRQERNTGIQNPKRDRGFESGSLHRRVRREPDFRVLQGHRRQADEAVRLCRADLCDLLVSQLDDLTGEVGLGLVPKDRVEAERLDIDALL